jgi:polysaccharide export outer membrane protein
MGAPVRIVIAAAIAAVVTTGCARGPHLAVAPGEYTTVQPIAGSSGLPTPTRADLSPAGRPYLIGPFDKLRIEVFGIEELGRDVQADSSGQIAFPLIGVVHASGKTPQELGVEIASRLRDRHVRDPQVTVNLTETVSQVVTIDGQVQQPGQYPVIGRMTLVRAIATARGTTEYARQSNVLIFREVGGQQLVGLYNLGSIRQGLYPDPEIYPNDVIIVDEARARRLFRDLLQLAPTLTAPLIAVLQSSNN